MPELGRSIGRYEVLRKLGEGGMAVVYLARQSDLQRFVALKELRALRGDDPSFAQRFLREARLAGSLTDPNVVTVYEYLEHDGTPYLAMEYLERGSLRAYVGELNLAQVSGVLEGVLAGLTSAEREGIVHRDLKPENVLVSSDGRVKIADFGIAKATTALHAGTFKTSTGMMIGTPAYMAPEQAMAEEVGPWTDLYSVGCLAFELFTGERPFHDVEAPAAILMRHATSQIPPVSSIVADIDPRISDWIERLLVKDPAQRTRSATAAWDEFEEISLSLLGPRWRREARLLEPGQPSRVDTDGRPTATAKPYTPPPPDLPPGPLAPPPEPDEPPAPRRSRRRPLLVAAALAVIAVAVVIALATRGDEAPPPTPGPGAVSIPAGNLTSNASFIVDTSGWVAFQSNVTRESAADAPDGTTVARVTATTGDEQYAIDDEPDTVEATSVKGQEYTATAWVKATPETDGQPVCLAMREFSLARTDGSFTAIAEDRVNASAESYQELRAGYVATASGNSISVHVYRFPGDIAAGDAFLVDAITLAPGPAGDTNSKLVDMANCGA